MIIEVRSLISSSRRISLPATKGKRLARRRYTPAPAQAGDAVHSRPGPLTRDGDFLQKGAQTVRYRASSA
jgi:hypothetical protein